MTNPLAQDLGGVVRLLEKATPGEWRAGFMHDGEFVESATDGGALQKGDGSFLAVSKTANGYNYQDAKAIAAAINFLRTHSAEIAGALRDAEAWRPIESAPTAVNELSKCGEPLLLGGHGWVETGFYHDGSDCYGHRGEAGWFALDDWGKDKLLCASNIHPTHWRPLPAPPTQDSAMQQGGGGGEAAA